MDSNLLLNRLEAPGQGRLDIGVEAHANVAGGGTGSFGGALGRAGKAGDLAEDAVERHRREGEPNHCQRQ